MHHVAAAIALAVTTIQIGHTIRCQAPHGWSNGDEAELHRLYRNVTIFAQGLLFMRFINIDTCRGVGTTPVVTVGEDTEWPLAIAFRFQKPEGNPHVGLCFNNALLAGVVAEVYWLVQFNDGLVVPDRCCNVMQSNFDAEC